ncbi:hypothetical protein [Streptomyces sp. NRRL F-5123]|uniref:hypothetical protein n=1 Tax=Streptomyces sp. NRRL F-5123 TaxID=1463856 RepID=UPI0004E1F805|nr:hypothetical protein [Streptomyces sp. NRRL F-5123]
MAVVVTTVLTVPVAAAVPAAADTPARSSHGLAHPAPASAAKPRTATPLDSTAWMTLDASRHTVNFVPLVGASGSSTLSAYSSFDVAPTAYYIQIWDLTAHTLLVSCPSGNTCSVNVTQSASTTHSFVGTVALSAASYPPAGIQSTSAVNYVAWVSGFAPYYSVSMSALSQTFPPYNGVLTATSTTDVGPTAYYIEIFDVTTGTLIAQCGTGTQCVATVSYADTAHTHVAFISGSGSSLPPPTVRAASNSM